MDQITILCGKLFSAKDGKVLPQMAVCINGDVITNVCPIKELPRCEGTVLDLTDKFVIPGLIDGHTHVNLGTTPYVEHYFQENTDGAIMVDSLLNAQQDLFAGFTTIRDEGAVNYTDVALKRAFDADRLVGPRMMVSGFPLTSTGGHADMHFIPTVTAAPQGAVCDTPDEMRKAARRNFKYGADQLKIMASGGVLSTGDDPRCSEFTYEEMRAAIEIAESKGRISSAHAHSADAIKIAIRAGITSIEHGMLMDDECIDMMAENGTYLIPTIIAAKALAETKGALPQWAVDKAKLVLEGHYSNLSKCRERGVKVGFGTDAGIYYDFHGNQAKEMQYMQEAGFSPEEILLAATRINAELMRWDSSIGTIEPGKLADIIAVDGDPLRDLSCMCSVPFVMKGGRIIKQNGISCVPLNIA